MLDDDDNIDEAVAIEEELQKIPEDYEEPEELTELTLDEVRLIARAASNVAGYVVGSNYRFEFEEGLDVLNEYGFNFTEASE